MRATNSANKIRLLREVTSMFSLPVLDKCVQIENRVVGAIVLSQTDAVSQESFLGSTQRVVVVCARAPRDAAVQHCIEYLGSWHPDFELEESARSVVQFEGVLFRKLHRALRMHRSTSMESSALWLTSAPRYTNSFVVWLYTLPAASTLNMAVDSGTPFARKHMISVLASDTVRPNAAHTTTINPIIFLSFSGDCETTPTSQYKACPKAASPGLTPRQLLPPAPPPPFSSSGVPKRP